MNKNNNMTAIASAITSANIQVERLGVVASPHGRFQEEGVLNPAVFQDRDGNLVMIMRSVAVGNQSRLETLRQLWKDGKPAVDASGNEVGFERVGFALVPQAKYERRRRATTSGSFELVGGEGCEDPRVTFIPELDCYVMCYTAFGFDGPRIALATSQDGYKWKRLGLVNIPSIFGLAKDDKDAAFFPEPVFSPSGEVCLAMYHRPMVNVPVSGTLDQIQSTFKADPTERQCVRIAYIPLAPVKDNLINLLNVTESDLVLAPGANWGCFKVGAGTVPIRIKEGWLEIFHGVDQVIDERTGRYHSCYSAGLLLHDGDEPHRLLYVSPTTILKPETPEELSGIVNNVVFPTGMVARPDLSKDGNEVFDIFYGMADRLIGKCRLTVSFNEA
ncbi:MAG: hypothetical protein C0464_03390 [Cyanobacteria bacterium DS2.008]|nr:hypothetical protein [Cyanobacteria bacterium DS2.008]